MGLIDKEMLSYLKLLHGSFNAFIFLLFLCQGSLGIRIRRRRLSGGQSPAGIVRWHRKLGPKLVLLGILGFCSGAFLALLDEGELFEHALHFTTGLLIAVALVATFLISRQIRGPSSPWRTPHFVVGLTIICLYLIQILLGLSILL
jgi:hypothetical protein